MKIRVLRAFRDKYTGQVYKPDEVLNLKKARGEEILANLPENYAEDVNAAKGGGSQGEQQAGEA